MQAHRKLLLGDEHLEWFYFYAAPEIANVMGYTAGQGFAYFMLRARCWMNGTLPDDSHKLVRWCNNAVSAEDVQFVLDEHFRLADGFWSCPELDDLREQAMKQRAVKSEAGRKAGLASAAKRESSTVVERSLNGRQPREEEVEGEGDGDKKETKKEMETKTFSAPTLTKEHSSEEFPSIPPRGPQRFEMNKRLREADPEKAERFLKACILKDAA